MVLWALIYLGITKLLAGAENFHPAVTCVDENVLRGKSPRYQIRSGGIPT